MSNGTRRRWEFLADGSFVIILLWRRQLDLLSSLVFVVFDLRIVLKFCYWLKQRNKSPLPLFCTGPAFSFYFWCCNCFRINATPHLCGLRGGCLLLVKQQWRVTTEVHKHGNPPKFLTFDGISQNLELNSVHGFHVIKILYFPHSGIFNRSLPLDCGNIEGW
jgi:hypothetical protein